MDTALDIFRADNFTVASIDRIIDNAPYIPQILGTMGIFTPAPISTIGVEIFQNVSSRNLIATTERGTPDLEQIREGGLIVNLHTKRLAKKDRVSAAELQDTIANWQYPNSPQALASAAELVLTRQGKLKQEIEMTMEYHRLGALQGLLLDANGTTVIYNYFNQFGVTQPATVTVDFANMSQTAFMQYWQDTFTRPIIRSLKNRITPTTAVAALVGDAFWNKLMTHPGFYAAVLTSQTGANLQGGANPLMAFNAWRTITFAGVTWINYMGTDDGTTIAIPSRNAVFFPMNATDVFRQYMAPGETFDDVNKPGKPWYGYVTPDPVGQMQEKVDIRVRSYPLFACIYPNALMKATIATGQ